MPRWSILLVLPALGCSTPEPLPRPASPPRPPAVDAAATSTPGPAPLPASGPEPPPAPIDGCAEPEPCTKDCPKPLLGLAAGDGHTCALSADGVLSCWGENAAGQLGDGTREPRSAPAEVARGIRAVAAGAGFTCMIEASGVRCEGALAREWTLNDVVPPDPDAVPPRPQALPITDAVSIAAGDNHVCTLDRDGQATCFLYAEPGSTTASIFGPERLAVPTRVPGATDLVEVAPGITSCGRTRAGGVLCWSYGGAATSIVGLAGVRSVATSFEEACAVSGPDRLVCWAPRQPTIRKERVVPGVVEVRAGGKGTLCARSASGRVSCWGRLGSEARRSAAGMHALPEPTPIGGTWGAEQLAVGAGHACAATPGGVRCWGAASRGTLGDGWLGEKPAPVEVKLEAAALHVAAHDFTTCAALMDGRVQCWGRGYRTGPGAMAEGPAAAIVRGVSGAQRVAVGEQQACAVTSGEVTCWPNHPEGGTEKIAGVRDAIAVAPGINGGCAATRSGETRCWWPGREASVLPGVRNLVELEYVASDWSCGRGRQGNMACWSTPLAFPSDTWPTPKVVPIAHPSPTVSVSKSCAARTDGSVACLGGTFHKPAATVVNGLSSAVEVSGGANFLCVRTRAGTIQCRGLGNSGELGAGATGLGGLGSSRKLRLASVSGITDAVAIATGWQHACTIRRGGSVWCWGDDTFGQVSGVASGLRQCARAVRR